MTQQPQAIEKGQVWVPTAGLPEPSREIAHVDSDGIAYTDPNAGWQWPGWDEASWTAWRDWQQRHAARVQTEENEHAD